MNALDDFAGATYLFDEYFSIGQAPEKKIPKPSTQKGKWVMILTEFDHLKDDLKKNFLAKVLSSIQVKLQEVLVQYQKEGEDLLDWTARYEDSILFVWTDELPEDAAYFQKTVSNSNVVYFFPSISNVMSDTSKKKALWNMLKADFIRQV